MTEPNPKYNAKLRIPTKQTYAFIEIDINGTIPQIMEEYCTAIQTYQQIEEEREKARYHAQGETVPF